MNRLSYEKQTMGGTLLSCEIVKMKAWSTKGPPTKYLSLWRGLRLQLTQTEQKRNTTPKDSQCQIFLLYQTDKPIFFPLLVFCVGATGNWYKTQKDQNLNAILWHAQ